MARRSYFIFVSFDENNLLKLLGFPIFASSFFSLNVIPDDDVREKKRVPQTFYGIGQQHMVYILFGLPFECVRFVTFASIFQGLEFFDETHGNNDKFQSVLKK